MLLRQARDGARSDQLAVKGDVGEEHVVAPGLVRLEGELQRAFDRLGAGIGEERLIEVARQQLRDIVAKRRKVWGEDDLVDLHPLLVLVRPAGRQDARMVVAVVEDAYAAREVQDAAAV